MKSTATETNGSATVCAPLPDVMRYESDIWNVADDLRGASIKESDWPAYMMPFFALMMLEGRMRNAARPGRLRDVADGDEGARVRGLARSAP